MPAMKSSTPHFLDRPAARIVAIGVIALALAALAAIHRDDLFGTEPQPETLNPEFVKCRDERVAQIAEMYSEGVISQRQRQQFEARAIALCASSFPPDAAR